MLFIIRGHWTIENQRCMGMVPPPGAEVQKQYQVQAGDTRNDSATISAMFSVNFSRFSSFCWHARASNKYLAGPIGLANDPLLALSGQQ